MTVEGPGILFIRVFIWWRQHLGKSLFQCMKRLSSTISNCMCGPRDHTYTLLRRPYFIPEVDGQLRDWPTLSRRCLYSIIIDVVAKKLCSPRSYQSLVWLVHGRTLPDTCIG